MDSNEPNEVSPNDELISNSTDIVKRVSRRSVLKKIGLVVGGLALANVALPSVRAGQHAEDSGDPQPQVEHLGPPHGPPPCLTNCVCTM